MQSAICKVTASTLQARCKCKVQSAKWLQNLCRLQLAVAACRVGARPTRGSYEVLRFAVSRVPTLSAASASANCNLSPSSAKDLRNSANASDFNRKLHRHFAISRALALHRHRSVSKQNCTIHTSLPALILQFVQPSAVFRLQL